MNLDNYKDFTRVIVIDDQRLEGDAMREALAKKDIASSFYCIQNTNDFPSSELPNVRLVFLDLILESLATPPTNDEAKAKHALGNLKRFIGEENLYILVIWTSKDSTDPVVEVLKKLLKADSAIATPFKIVTLNKGEYGVTHVGTVDFDKIQKAIEDALSDIPAFEVFSEGERLANNGIADSIAGIVKEQDNASLSRIINSLACAYSGKLEDPKDSLKLEDPKDSLKLGAPKDSLKLGAPKDSLLALNEVFKDEIEKKIILNNFTDLTLEDGTLTTEDEKAPLNTSMIFSSDNETKGSGAIYFPSLNNKDKEEHVEDIVNNPSYDTNSLDFIPIYVDVTPLCNSAWDKGETYILKALLFLEKNKKKIKESYCYLFRNTILYDSKNYKIAFNLKSYCTKIELIENLCPERKFRSNITIDIQHKVASYISRPGHLLL